MVRKVFKTAPLPFQGQKRNFVPQFKEALKVFVEKHQVSTIVDLFGGSGLLSHTAKSMYPRLHVIYNDFDNFRQRLDSVNITNAILGEIRPLVAHLPKHGKIDPLIARSVLEVIKEREVKGLFVDYITLSSSLLFSANYVTSYEALAKETLYQNLKKVDYETAGYLDGLEVVRMDYKALYEEYKGKDGILFVIDPPYLSTDVSTYNSMKYWRLKNYLDVMKLLEGNNYVFFTSNKSSLIELYDWLEANYMLRNPFSKAVVSKYLARTGGGGGYTDLMYYRAIKK